MMNLACSKGVEQGSVECRAAGKRRGRAAAVDSGAQGHGGLGLGGRLKQGVAPAVGGSSSGNTDEAGLGGGAAVC